MPSNQESITAVVQITIDWVDHGTLHFLDCLPLNRSSMIEKALEILRSGQFNVEGDYSNNNNNTIKAAAPSILHATLRRVHMGGNSLLVSSRIQDFSSLYTSVSQSQPGVMPVIEVEIRSGAEGMYF